MRKKQEKVKELGKPEEKDELGNQWFGSSKLLEPKNQK